MGGPLEVFLHPSQVSNLSGVVLGRIAQMQQVVGSLGECQEQSGGVRNPCHNQSAQSCLLVYYVVLL